MENIEHKQFAMTEFKADGDQGKFSGYASTYNRDAYGDRIIPGAFSQSIKDQRGVIPIFMNHSTDNWVGFSTDLAEDAKGLYIEGLLALDTSQGKDAYALLKTADKADYKVGLSIGFVAEEWELDDTNNRILKTIDLWETSITPFPANRSARVASVKSVRNIEQILRDVGLCSKESSKRAIALLTPYLSADADGSPSQPLRDVRALGQFRSERRRLEWRAALEKEFSQC
jgi:hypothetical protein